MNDLTMQKSKTPNQLTYSKNNIGREIIPMKIRNQTGKDNLYFYLVGTTKPTSPANNWYHLSNINGDVKKCVPTGGKPTNYALPLKEEELIIMLPRLEGIRVYISYEKPIEVYVGEEGIPSSPDGWNASSTNYKTIFDWIEITWVQNANDMTLGGNTTQVDMFGMPMSLQVTGFDAEGNKVTKTGGFKETALRTEVINAIFSGTDPNKWESLVISENSSDLRVISPVHGLARGLFPKYQLDTYINDVWEKYKNDTLHAAPEGQIYLGNIINEVLEFRPENEQGKTIRFKKPTTEQAYSSGPVATDPAVEPGKTGVLGAALQAGFMRTTLLISNTLPECDATKFYEDKPINMYAKAFHNYGIDGKAYAFGFDDVCSQSSVIIVHNPQSTELTLLGWD